MVLQCILYYVLAALGGGLIGWLIFGGKNAQVDQIRQEAARDKHALNDAVNQFSKFKNEAKAQIVARESEISKLKKSSSLPDIITKAQEKEIKHWKQKAAELETQIKSNPSNNSKPSKQLARLQADLEVASIAIKDKNSRINKLKLELEETQKAGDPKSAPSEDYMKLKKKLKNLKKKVKSQKKELGAIKTVTIKETLDIDKLSKLLAQGKLTSKTKKVSKKKAKKAKSKSDS